MLDVAISFSEDEGVWTEVWGHASLLIEEETVLLLDGQLTFDAKHLTLTDGFLNRTAPV